MISKSFVIAMVMMAIFTNVVSVTCQGDQAAAEDAPMLVLRKQILQERAVVGKELTVELTVYNIGQSTAFDVSVLDDSWFEANEIFEPIIGLKKITWTKIAPGSNATHAIILRPLKKGYYTSVPAAISYSSASGKQQLGFSNNLGDMYVFSPRELDRNTTPNVREWINFSVLATVPIGFPALVYYWIQKNFKDGLQK
eukprot:TRINITY_DN496_c0_g2_i2.p1 TRINITY_DN496_c0_g2~~TRINITY_DN496_c0_g2_i2.p1  ORF type:complete len:197 (+),score=43.36 TRINITY_DN496_c0_g2_i2:54-644(+)